MEALRQGSRHGTSGPASRRLRHALVVTEVAMSLLLLVEASLLLRSVVRLQGQGISPVDPPTLTGAAGLLLAVAAVASTIPAARVLRIDPVAALRRD